MCSELQRAILNLINRVSSFAIVPRIGTGNDVPKKLFWIDVFAKREGSFVPLPGVGTPKLEIFPRDDQVTRSLFTAKLLAFPRALERVRIRLPTRKSRRVLRR